MTDPFHLERFVSAQDEVFPRVLAELGAGEKRSHWIWFIFPQMKGLGHSPLATYYGLASLQEAIAYARHPILGSRLIQCTGLINQVEGRTIHQIFGSPDDMKFHSSMTLFTHAVPEEPVFQKALDKYFGGQPDPLTLVLL
jgi:uncharacterized protein (DUF1810 family)